MTIFDGLEHVLRVRPIFAVVNPAICSKVADNLTILDIPTPGPVSHRTIRDSVPTVHVAALIEMNVTASEFELGVCHSM